jgi:hypothetical protein
LTFTVIWMRGPQALGTKRFEALAPATAHAVDNLRDVQANFGATAVKIVDDDGSPHFLKSISRHG